MKAHSTQLAKTEMHTNMENLIPPPDNAKIIKNYYTWCW